MGLVDCIGFHIRIGCPCFEGFACFEGSYSFLDTAEVGYYLDTAVDMGYLLDYRDSDFLPDTADIGFLHTAAGSATWYYLPSAPS